MDCDETRVWVFPQLLKSLAIRALALLLLLLVGRSQTARIQQREEAVYREILQQRQLDLDEARLEEQSLADEMLNDT